MHPDAGGAWCFSAFSTEELTRRYVLVEHLEQVYGLSREQLVAAAQAEPRFCHLGKFFKVIGPDGTRGYHVTHIAFNPDEGYEPARPYRATDVFGPVMRAQKRRRSDTSPPEEESPAVAARQQEAPESPGGATPKPRRLSRPVKGRHGAGGVDAFANANTEKAVAARTFYRNELAFLEAQLEERVEARLADEGAKMKRDAVASVAKANEEARWQYERKAATQLQLVEEALAEERRLNAEMKTHEWREENLYEPRRRAHEALQAAEQRASSAEQRACAADAQRIEAVSAADAAARACGADYDRALAAETQKVAESTSELADCVLLLQQSTDTCDARKRECRRSGKELASVRQKLDAVTADLETSSLRKRWLESTNQSLYDRLENKAGRIRELLTEARQHKIDAAASARTLVASQKLTAQLQGAGGVDARLFDNAAVDGGSNRELPFDFIDGAQWTWHDGSRAGRVCRRDRRRDDRRARPDAGHHNAQSAGVQLHRDGVGRDRDDCARGAGRPKSLDALKQPQWRVAARALARGHIQHRWPVAPAQAPSTARGPPRRACLFWQGLS
mmetsp:Transcript_913/g.2930  ORF Transcript_913/g.2930 Transcript_913/m.2930 type:complete len:564 (-) Transcript_913:46-1737(-)